MPIPIKDVVYYRPEDTDQRYPYLPGVLYALEDVLLSSPTVEFEREVLIDPGTREARGNLWINFHNSEDDIGALSDRIKATVTANLPDELRGYKVGLIFGASGRSRE